MWGLVAVGGGQSSFQWFHSSDGNSKQTQASSSTGRSIRPGTAVPSTVLVSDMGDGSLLLEGWRDGPSAYLSPAGAAPLRRLLAAAFGSSDLAPSDSRGESG